MGYYSNYVLIIRVLFQYWLFASMPIWVFKNVCGILNQRFRKKYDELQSKKSK